MASADRIKRIRRKKRQAAVYQYQKDGRYFAQVADSLKEAGAKELAELGADDVRPEFSGIRFKADKSTLYRINLRDYERDFGNREKRKVKRSYQKKD